MGVQGKKGAWFFWVKLHNSTSCDCERTAEPVSTDAYSGDIWDRHRRQQRPDHISYTVHLENISDHKKIIAKSRQGRRRRENGTYGVTHNDGYIVPLHLGKRRGRL